MIELQVMMTKTPTKASPLEKIHAKETRTIDTNKSMKIKGVIKIFNISFGSSRFFSSPILAEKNNIIEALIKETILATRQANCEIPEIKIKI